MPHPDDEGLALYALETLDAPDRQAVEAAIADNPDLKAALAAYQAAVGAIPYGAPSIEMSPKLRQRLLKWAFEQVIDANAATQAQAPNPTLVKRAAELRWRPYQVPGVMIGMLHIDKAKQESAYLMQAVAGVNLPVHYHTHEEEMLILEGDLMIDDQVYSKGDYIRSLPGSRHSPRTKGGCLVFVRMLLDDSFA